MIGDYSAKCPAFNTSLSEFLMGRMVNVPFTLRYRMSFSVLFCVCARVQDWRVKAGFSENLVNLKKCVSQHPDLTAAMVLSYLVSFPEESARLINRLAELDGDSIAERVATRCVSVLYTEIEKAECESEPPPWPVSAHLDACRVLLSAGRVQPIAVLPVLDRMARKGCINPAWCVYVVSCIRLIYDTTKPSIHRIPLQRLIFQITLNIPEYTQGLVDELAAIKELMSKDIQSL